MKFRNVSILLFTLFILTLSTVQAETLLNITFNESIHRNVSFAREFELIEVTDFILIDGDLTVINPSSTETVYDIYVQLMNTSTTQNGVFVWQNLSGWSRYGVQTIYPKESPLTFQDSTVPENNLSNVSWSSLGVDVDEDGVNDSIMVNNTDFVFNITSEYNLIGEPIRDSSGAATSITTAGSGAAVYFNVSFNLTSTSTHIKFNENRVYARINITGSTNVDGNINDTTVANGNFTINITDHARTYAVVHIPELNPGNYTVFNYNVTSDIQPPLDINTTYFNRYYNKKVLASEQFNITDNATNVGLGLIYDVNVSIVAMQVNFTNYTDGEIQTNFTFEQVFNASEVSEIHNYNFYQSDWANVNWSVNGSGYWTVGTPASLWNYTSEGWGTDTDGNIVYPDPKQLVWTINGGTMQPGSTYQIHYAVRAPDSVPDSASYLAVMQTLNYKSQSAASQLYLGEVRAKAHIAINETKRIRYPADNESNNNVTWETIPKVYTDKDINYTLETVTMWVTTTLNPNEKWLNWSLNYTYEPNTRIHSATSWEGSRWLFNFTDGTNGSAQVPIIWIKPEWVIENNNSQIINESMIQSGSDLYFKYIYVVHGYWLEITKNITAQGNNTYLINNTVFNRGNGYTPQNMTVTIYDFVPSEFVADTFSPSYDSSSTVEGEFAGTAYLWDVGMRTAINTSFSPAGSTDGYDEYSLTYIVRGDGLFRATQLYVVGLDPRAVDGASASPLVSIVSGIASTSTEFIYMAVVIILIAINVGNFVLTSRINKKIDRRRFQ